MQGRKSLDVALAVVLAVLALRVAGNNNCDYNTCSDCIGAPSCIWCSDPNITLVKVDTGGTLSHCISKQSSSFDKFKNTCNGTITDPPTKEDIIEDEPLSEDNKVQLSPQKIDLEMRAGESANLTIKYRHLRNYPMDVYCLMDNSKSMSPLKTVLSDATNDLVDGLEKLTNNIRLGFGMFVDKPILPYTDMNNWQGDNCINCAESYSFKNVLALTTDRTSFQDKVKHSKNSTNIDLPEGTLDALMQVASCPNHVGWREQGVRVVVVFTDAGFHIAGDGRLAGIVKPNDKECHLNNEGEYTHSKWQDYPSVSELSSVLEASSVYTTFAVDPKLVPLYKLLTSQLPHSDCSNFTEDSNNIVSIITEFAKGAISTVTMNKPKKVMEEVTVSVISRCKGNEEKPTSTCQDMDPGDEAEFIVNIKVKSCPEKGPQNTTLTFTLDGSPQTLTVDLRLLCQCECDQTDQGLILNAAECSDNGDLRCGVCYCHDGFLGEKCQCKEGDLSSQEIDEKNCIQPNVSNPLVCSGQGQCVCGQCQCKERDNPDEVISGQFCECTNYKNCKGSIGGICSGHGECKCDTCHCNDGWKGQYCDCETATTECQAPGEEEICSKQGKCVCNKCQCEEGYLGKHCQDCQNCEMKCDEHKFCVECLVFDTGDGCKASCSNYSVTIVSDITTEYGQLCSSTDDEGCRFLYQFKHNEDEVMLWAEIEKECPTVVNPWAIVGGILGAVVLVGLLLLIIWKIITYFKDKREYEKFVKNKSLAVWSENVSPLYKPATTTVQNPMFESTSAHQD